MNKIITTEIMAGYGEKTVLEKQSISIPAEKVTVILGPNGCGKSTFLKSIARILRPSHGEILLDGLNLFEMETKEIAKKLSFLAQSPVSPEGITIRQLVSYGRFPYQGSFGRLKKEDLSILDKSIKLADLMEVADCSLSEVSGGQRQRAWIAMALAQQTGILLLDEPTTYLDVVHQLETLALLRFLNKAEQRTVAMVLHDINLAARFGDWIIAMRGGNVIATGTPMEIINTDVLRKVFQIDADVVWDSKHSCPVCLCYDRSDKPLR